MESWPVEGLALVLEGEPAWRCEILPEEAATVELPLVPGGYVAPRPPFFTPLPSTLQARKLALGYEHAVLLNTEGALFSWGGGRHGQLGHGELESRTEPQLVEALHGVPLVDVAAGGWHSAGISGDTELSLAEQEGAQGPCKAAFISIQAFPALLDMPDGEDVCKISCGSRHTAAVTCAGELYTWGWGKYGQLGHGQTASSDEAKRVSCFVDWGLRVVDVVCGPWTTYVHAVAQ
nr:RCC1 domain-containing protein 1 isoform X2 [Zootoca vivipara]